MNIPGSRSSDNRYALPINLLSFLYVAGYVLFDADPRTSRAGIVITLLIVSALLAKLLTTRHLVLPRLLPVPLVFAAFVVASTLWANDFGQAQLYAQMTLSAMCGAVAIWLALYNGLSYRTLLLAALTGSVIVIAASVRNPEQIVDVAARSGGTFSNPNAAAVYLTCCALLIASPPPETNRVSRLSLLIAGLIVVSAVVFTGSRKTLFTIGLIAVYAAIVLVRQNKSRLAAYKAPALIALAAIVAAALFIGPNLDSIVHLIEKVGTLQRFSVMLQGHDESAIVRKALIVKGIELWQQKPWIGYGYGQFSGQTLYSSYSHCNYVELLYGTGILGTLLYYSFYMMIFAQSIRPKRPQQLAALTIVGISLLIDTASVSIISKPSWIMAVVGAYLAATDRSIVHLTLQAGRPDTLLSQLRSRNRLVQGSLQRVLREPAVNSALDREQSDG